MHAFHRTLYYISLSPTVSMVGMHTIKVQARIYLVSGNHIDITLHTI